MAAEWRFFMNMKRCGNGHFYDSERYQQCPYCGISNSDASKTMPIVRDRDEDEQKRKQEIHNEVKQTDSEKTVGIYQHTKHIDPVVGWVVCVEGPSKGRDYRIRAERNFIGRDSDMDIAVTEDSGISRKNHAIISFNPRTGTFRLLCGESRGLVYLNDEELLEPALLNAGDIIEIGATKLKFVPFCGADFSW